MWFSISLFFFSPNSVSHWGVLTVRVKPLRSRCFFLSPSFFTAQGHRKRHSGGQNLRFACAKPWLGIFFLRLAVAPWRFCSSGCESSWIHFIWTEDASPEVKICVSPAQGHKKCISAVQNLRFACAKHSVGLFSLRRATQNASPELKICVSPARNAPADLGRTVFPAQGHAKRVSGGQNLRFACAGPQNRMIRML